MRKMMFGFGAAVLVAGMLAFAATPASAVVSKSCWSHQDTDPLSEDYGQYVAVWANGGGHANHVVAGTDTLLGPAESYKACVVLFEGGL